VAAHQQVGDFIATNVNGTIVKQGGNVASYFCTPGGRVIHAVIGPVNADELLKEANWALTAWNKAKQLRELGFGTVSTHQQDGIVRGTGTIVLLGDERENQNILKDQSAEYYSFNKGIFCRACSRVQPALASTLKTASVPLRNSVNISISLSTPTFIL